MLSIPATIVLAGCIGGEPTPLPPEAKDTVAEDPAPVDPAPAAQPVPMTPAPVAPAPKAPAPARVVPPSRPVVAQPLTQPVPQAPAGGVQADVVREKAKAGMGKKGQGIGRNMFTVPIITYFITRDRLAFEAQVPHAMKLFRATHGYYPRTQEEFMEKIIKPGNIPLPVLPRDHRYYYDPEKGELMVERPR
jgi:hypothetical protein